MKAQVLCRARPGVTLTFSLKGAADSFEVGREPGMAVSVPFEGVSRRHARIVLDSGDYWVEDLKSTNGTFLNGQPVGRERLHSLDVITLGKKVDLVFVLRSEESGPAKRMGIVKASIVPDGADAAPYDVRVGEITIGRGAGCNVLAESGAVSKIHARLERSLDQLVLQDLGSANGTFVNGQRVMTAVLKDGDVISLAGVENYRVVVATGEVTSASGGFKAVTMSGTGKTDRPRFSADWKTRYEWDPTELEQLAELQRQVAERDKEKLERRGKTTKRVDVVKPAGPAAKPGAAAPAGKPAAVPPRPPVPPAPEKPAAAAKAVPESKPAPPAGAAPAARPAAPVVPPPSLPAAAAKPPSPPPSPAEPVVPAAPAAAPPPPPAPSPVAAAPARPPGVSQAQAPPASPTPEPPPAPGAPPAARPSGPMTASEQMSPTLADVPAPVIPSPGPRRIVELRLSGSGFAMSASEPGAHELGRAAEARLRVNHPTVSRKHARLIISEDLTMVYLQDMGGANGTRLNGVTVERISPVADGDSISIGEVTLTVSLRWG